MLNALMSPPPLIDPSTLQPRETKVLAWMLRIATVGALVGHGAYGAVLARAAWVDYLGVLGIRPGVVDATSLIALLGWLEIGLGVLVLLRPICAVLLWVVFWKVSTELLRPLAGEPGW
jgi:hypothetical protein